MPFIRTNRLYFVFILFPLSLLYGIVVFFRNLLFDLGIIKSEHFPFPVISVGNLTIGGTGKTPHVEYLIKLLKDSHRIAVLSRGYKRKTKGFQLAVTGSTAEEIGDELLQIHNRFPEILVAADSDRIHGIGQLIAKFPGLEIIILDDAFQHRYVNPGLSIVLVDYKRPVFRDFLLPMGNLREYRCNINRADIVIVTKCPPGMDELQQQDFIRRLRLWHEQPVFFTYYQYGDIIPVLEEKSGKTFTWQNERNYANILMVTGIADYRPLKDYLSQFTVNVIVLSFADHHSYKPNDIRIIEQKLATLPADSTIIITTEKDATKFKEIPGELDKISPFLYYIPVEVRFLEEEDKSFNEMIISFCSEKTVIL
ncbi:MAG: tetraacyldisaccharide 4'-kinase [Bacteroidales bacterium]|nr:tetraacyldisaccharide 4'-kinase [Bacteroidales bacterium]